MDTQVFFNSSYYDKKFENRSEAARAFSSMVEGLKRAIDAGAKDSLVSRSDALETELTNGYCIRDWVQDRSGIDGREGDKIDREIQRYFARRVDKAPYFEDAEYIECDDYLGCEVDLYDDQVFLKSPTATLSFIKSGIILSPPLSVFCRSFLDSKVYEIEEEYDEQLRCIFNETSVSPHIDYIRSSAGIKVSKSDDLWEHRENLFPSLEFCPRVENQLQGLPHFSVIYSRLKELEQYVSSWTTGAFIPDEIPSKASGESDSVKNNARAILSRTFECPDGEERVFFWHLRATPGAIRIHFYPIEQEHKIIIGHIGEKLYYSS